MPSQFTDIHAIPKILIYWIELSPENANNIMKARYFDSVNRSKIRGLL